MAFPGTPLPPGNAGDPGKPENNEKTCFYIDYIGLEARLGSAGETPWDPWELLGIPGETLLGPQDALGPQGLSYSLEPMNLDDYLR